MRFQHEKLLWKTPALAWVLVTLAVAMMTGVYFQCLDWQLLVMPPRLTWATSYTVLTSMVFPGTRFTHALINIAGLHLATWYCLDTAKSFAHSAVTFGWNLLAILAFKTWIDPSVQLLVVYILVSQTVYQWLNGDASKTPELVQSLLAVWFGLTFICIGYELVVGCLIGFL